MNWDTDTQYTEERLQTVEPSPNGWTLSFESGGCLFCPNDLCQRAPVTGETARLYGKGFGYTVRGLVIEGRVYRYLTEAQQAADHEAWVQGEKDKRKAQLERERADRDARRAKLPEVFRERLDTYEKRNPLWRQEFEPYELSVCEDAVAIAKHCGTTEDTEADIAALERFNGLSWEEQRAAIPTLFDGHSGNSWNAAMGLAGRYMRSPKFVRGAHGALCGLVGCESYGCPGADLKKEESDAS